MTARTILIIDDDDLYCEALRKRLEKKNFVVFSQSNIDSTLLPFIKENSIEIVLLDLIMPKVGGKEVLQLIRSEYDREKLPVIMVTGMDSSDDAEETFKLGANDYITKPITLEMAVARIKAHLSQVDLAKERILKKELEAVHALVVTCSHQINNPLSILVSEVSRFKKAYPEIHDKEFKKITKSLERLRETMSNISQIDTKSELKYENYVDGTKMVKID